LLAFRVYAIQPSVYIPLLKRIDLRPNLKNFLCASLRITGGPGDDITLFSELELESTATAANAVKGSPSMMLLNFMMASF
jgi:hypothetical protein